MRSTLSLVQNDPQYDVIRYYKDLSYAAKFTFPSELGHLLSTQPDNGMQDASILARIFMSMVKSYSIARFSHEPLYALCQLAAARICELLYTSYSELFIAEYCRLILLHENPQALGNALNQLHDAHILNRETLELVLHAPLPLTKSAYILALHQNNTYSKEKLALYESYLAKWDISSLHSSTTSALAQLFGIFSKQDAFWLVTDKIMPRIEATQLDYLNSSFSYLSTHELLDDLSCSIILNHAADDKIARLIRILSLHDLFTLEHFNRTHRFLKHWIKPDCYLEAAGESLASIYQTLIQNTAFYEEYTSALESKCNGQSSWTIVERLKCLALAMKRITPGLFSESSTLLAILESDSPKESVDIILMLDQVELLSEYDKIRGTNLKTMNDAFYLLYKEDELISSHIELLARSPDPKYSAELIIKLASNDLAPEQHLKILDDYLCQWAGPQTWKRNSQFAHELILIFKLFAQNNLDIATTMNLFNAKCTPDRLNILNHSFYILAKARLLTTAIIVVILEDKTPLYTAYLIALLGQCDFYTKTHLNYLKTCVGLQESDCFHKSSPLEVENNLALERLLIPIIQTILSVDTFDERARQQLFLSLNQMMTQENHLRVFKQAKQLLQATKALKAANLLNPDHCTQLIKRADVLLCPIQHTEIWRHLPSQAFTKRHLDKLFDICDDKNLSRLKKQRALLAYVTQDFNSLPAETLYEPQRFFVREETSDVPDTVWPEGIRQRVSQY